MNTPCSVFKARYVLGVSLEDDAVALEAEGAFGILLTKGRMGLNMQDKVGVECRADVIDQERRIQIAGI